MEIIKKYWPLILLAILAYMYHYKRGLFAVTPAGAPAGTPLRQMLPPLFFDDTSYPDKPGDTVKPPIYGGGDPGGTDPGTPTGGGTFTDAGGNKSANFTLPRKRRPSPFIGM